MRICVLALDGVFDTGLSAILDTLQLANELAAGKSTIRGAEVTLSGVRRRVRTQQGFQVTLAALPKTRPDVVVLPALGAKTPEALESRLAERDIGEVAGILRAWAKAGTLLTAACTATFVLASSGLLDDRAATTTWWLSPYFRQRFPRVALDESRMIVQAGKLVTAGAALAHFDLALWLVRRISPKLAQTAAHYLVFDGRPSQAAYVEQSHLAHSDPLIEAFERWTRRHLQNFSLEDAARAIGTSERTLERRVRSVLGTSPVSFLQDLRVERAVQQLKTSTASVDEIAEAVGYGDATTLRTLLRKKTGRGVRELRSSHRA